MILSTGTNMHWEYQALTNLKHFNDFTLVLTLTLIADRQSTLIISL